MEYFVLFCVGSALFYLVGGLPRLVAGARELRRAWALDARRSAPVLKAGDVRDGPVRVRGRVRVVGKVLRAPDGTHCVAYEEQQGVLGAVQVSATTFEVQSGGTSIRVEPGQAVIAVGQVRGLLGERMRIVQPGDVVTVYGVAVRVPDVVGPLAEYRRESARIVVRAAPDMPLVIERGRARGLENLAWGAGLFASAILMLALAVVIWI